MAGLAPRVLSFHVLKEPWQGPAHPGFTKVKSGGLLRRGLAAEAEDEDFVVLIDQGSAVALSKQH